mmetsp:Transcript_40440/g.75751  ORF Transcript_40440/g.75751 Transcript_40440/m.75751 type:complete len:275 (-) Transcript_40440:38-862(-)
MGAQNCQNCCSDQRIEVPTISETHAIDEADIGIWEEVVQHTGKLSRDLCEMPLKPLPHARNSMRLEFSLKGSREEVGLELQMLPEPDPALVVSGVDPEGELARTADGSPGICPGDIIVEVESQTASPPELFARLRRCCTTSDNIMLSVRPRPRAFTVELTRMGQFWQRLGLSVALKPDKGFMMIAAVHEVGLVPEWNAKHNQCCICIGDRITGVNGRHGDAIAMYALVQATSLNGRLQLTIEPPPRYLVPLLEAWATQRVNGSRASPNEHLEML